MAQPGTHWHDVYAHTPITDLSWFQPNPAVSIELIRQTGADPDSPIVDVGGGASTAPPEQSPSTIRDLAAVGYRRATAQA